MSSSPSLTELLVSADNEVHAQIRARLDAESRARVASTDLRSALRRASSRDARACAAEAANAALARDVATLVHRLRTLRAANASLLRRCGGARSDDLRRESLEAENAALRARLRASEEKALHAALRAADAEAELGAAEASSSCASCARAAAERDDALRERDAAVRGREAAAADHDAELLDVEATVARLADEQARVEAVLRVAATEKRQLLARIRELEGQSSLHSGATADADVGGGREARAHTSTVPVEASTPPRYGAVTVRVGERSPPPTQKVVRSAARTPLAEAASELATPGDPSFPLPSPLRTYAALLDNVRETTARARAARGAGE